MSIIASTTANSMRIAGYYFYAESQQIYLLQIVKHYYPPRKSATSVQKVILSDKQKFNHYIYPGSQPVYMNKMSAGYITSVQKVNHYICPENNHYLRPAS